MLGWVRAVRKRLRSARNWEKVPMVVFGSSVVACVSWVRCVWHPALRARIREMAFSNGLVGSSAVS